MHPQATNDASSCTRDRFPDRAVQMPHRQSQHDKETRSQQNLGAAPSVFRGCGFAAQQLPTTRSVSNVLYRKILNAPFNYSTRVSRVTTALSETPSASCNARTHSVRKTRERDPESRSTAPKSLRT